MRKHIWVYLLPTIVLSACKCDKQQVIKPIGDDMYRYVFKDTSTWIYRNTTTNEEDTVLLYKSTMGLVKEDTSDKSIDLQKHVFQLHCVSSMFSNSPIIYMIDYHGINLNGSRTFPYYGVEVYNRLTTPGASSGYSTFLTEYPYLIIEGQMIYHVRKFELQQTSADYPHKTFLYWAPSIGLVRKEIQDTVNGIQIWDLKYSSLKYE